MTQTNDPPLISSLELIPDAAEKADLDAPNTSGGKLVIGQAPNITITETNVVADAAERLALDVQEGDIAVQTNVSTSFIFTGGDNVANNWETLDFDAVGAINGEDINPRDITPRNITASGNISLQDLTVAGAINGADTSAAAAGEALTSDGSGGFSFVSVGGEQTEILKDNSPIEYVGLNDSDLPSGPSVAGDTALVVADNAYKSYVNPPTLSGSRSSFNETGAPFNRVDAVQTNDDGSRFYFGDVVGGDRIRQVDVNSNFEMLSGFSNAVDLQVGDKPRAMVWNNDGSKLFAAVGSDIREFTFSTNFDIGSTLISDNSFTLPDVARGIRFNDDGSSVITIDGNNVITKRDLSTAFDITSNITTDTTFDTNGQGRRGLHFGNNGKTMFTVGADDIYEWNLTSNYDPSTATFVQSRNSPIDYNTTEFLINPSGTRFYYCSFTGAGGNNIGRIAQENFNPNSGWL